MPEQYSNLTLFVGSLCLFVLFWVLSIVLVYGDLTRRQVGGTELVAWMALAVVLPIIGLLAYLFYRLLGVVFKPFGRPGRKEKVRETLLKADPAAKRRSTTIPATDYLKNTQAEFKPPRIPRTDAQRGAASADLPYQEQALVNFEVTEGPHKGAQFTLRQLPASIGRGPDATISLDEDRGVSRQHAEIYDQAGVVRIRDLKSTHGTQVNGFGIGDKSLDPGDQIQIGRTVLVVGFKGAGDDR